MQTRAGLRRALVFVAVVLLAAFGSAAIVVAIDATDESGADRATAPSTTVTSPVVTSLPDVPAPPTTTTEPPPPPPTEPPAPPPPAPRAAAVPAARPALAPAPAAAASGGCWALPAGGLIAAHQAYKPYSASGGLAGGAQSFAFTLCNAHALGNLFHSGAAAGENVGWIGAGGCVNDANAIFQAWLNSPAHRANIDRFSVVGAGVACDGANTYFVAQYG